MTDPSADAGTRRPGSNSLSEVLRVEGGRVLATLIRLTGDIDLAQDALQDAVVTALEKWTTTNRPDNLAAWLNTTAKHKAIDRIRREHQRLDKEAAAVLLSQLERGDPSRAEDLLRLVFTCCHPSLALETQTALCLRTVCQLTTGEIARAFLVTESTMTRRITRAKHKIRDAHIPYRIPSDAEMPDRLDAVLAVLYLMFTTGHHAPAGMISSRVELADEATRVTRLLTTLMPDEPEVRGLLALCLATEARRAARLDDSDDIVGLADQDRTRWNHDAIAEASALIQRSLAAGRHGPYQLQAAIACLHGEAQSYDQTDWKQISYLYRLLERLRPTPVVRVNRAVAEAEIFGPRHALRLITDLDPEPDWHLYWAAVGEFHDRLGNTESARDAFTNVLAYRLNDSERRHFSRRLAALDPPGIR